MATNYLSKPDILNVFVPRLLIQGGLSNEEYGRIDYRLLHKFATSYTNRWKNCKDVGPDSKFTDISVGDFKCEGKRIDSKGVIEITPSRDTGAERKFNPENLNSALALNQAYHFYEAEFIGEHTIKFTVYWCPIDILKKVYQEHGKNGVIRKAKKHLFEPYFKDIVPTVQSANPPLPHEPVS